MYLRFFGSDSGFGKEHTSAYFCTKDNELVIIDCPISTFQKLKDENYINLKNYKKIYVLITHTHGDHIGGLGLFIQYVYFVLKIHIAVVAPSSAVARDIASLLTIEDNSGDWYTLLVAENLKDKSWFVNSILTKHSTYQLKGKCFGYQFNINDTNVVYTGDTVTLEPFIPYLSHNSILYTDVSVYYGAVHLKLKDAMNDFISLLNNGVKKIYLMHLDDAVVARNIVSEIEGIEVVEVYKPEVFDEVLY